MASFDARAVEDSLKTKEQLINELVEMRRRLEKQGRDCMSHAAVEARESDTKYESAEQRLHWIEALVRQMSTSSPLGYVVVNNRTDELLFINDLVCDIWGIHDLRDGIVRGELKVDDVLPRCFRMVKEPEAFLARCDFLRSGGDRSVTEDEIEFSDGRTIRCFSARLCDDANRCFGRLFMFEDITARKKIEEALRENEVKFRLLSEQSLLGMAIIQAGKAKYVNTAASTLLGYSTEEIMDWGPKELAARIHPDDRWHVMDQAWKKLLGDSEATPCYRFRLMTKSGSSTWIEIYSRTVSYEGKNADFIMIIDITDRKKAEEIMFQGERIKAVADLAGGVAHNFNNMLQAVSGGAQLALKHLQSGNLAAATGKLNLILESSRFGAETVKRLQDFALVSIDQASSEGRVFDLANIVNEVLQMSEPLWKSAAEKRGVSIYLRHDLEANCFVKGSQTELFDVVANLIKNSIEAMPHGGDVHVRCFSEGTEVILEVRDSGVGISQESLSKVFDPFWTTKGVHGTGMGLASTFGIVRHHNGTILVQSEEEKGTVFTVRLPLFHPSVKEDESIESDFTNLSLRLLVVDNDPTILALLEEGLCEYGQTALIAPSGREAIDVFNNTNVDMVICDLGMPVMNGWQVGKALKEICVQKRIPKPPFILLTGWGAQINEQDELAESGFDRVVGKPVTIPKLLEIVRTVYEKTGNKRHSLRI